MKLIFIVLFVLVTQQSYANGRIVVVVSDQSGIESLDNQQVANIFLARTKIFPNGNHAIPVELNDNNIRSLFNQGISGKTPSQLNAYWTTLVFTGKGKPPKRISDNEKLYNQLIENPDTIGYIFENQIHDKKLKVVYRFP